jgi:hypothetical protein
MLAAAQKTFHALASNRRLVWLGCALLAMCALSFLAHWMVRPDYVKRHLLIVSQTPTNLVFRLPTVSVSDPPLGRVWYPCFMHFLTEHCYMLANDARQRLLFNEWRTNGKNQELTVRRPRASACRIEVNRIIVSDLFVPGVGAWRQNRREVWLSDVITNDMAGLAESPLDAR